MTSTDLVFQFVDAFEQLQIPYMLVGSYSSNVYGRPRSTQDADFVVQVSGDEIAGIRELLAKDFVFDPQMSFETVTATMRYVATHMHSPFKIELFLLSNDAHDKIRFERRQRWDIEGHKVWFPTAEDVVITKLRWSGAGNRAKDLEDVRQVLNVRLNELDLPYIWTWCDQHGTRKLLDDLVSAVQSRRNP